MEKSEGHLSVQVGVLRPWWWSRVGQLQFPATLLQMCHEEWRPMGLQHVCANFMRIVNSPVLYMSKFFPIRTATDAYVRYVSKCTMSLITVWSCLCCWTLVIHEGLFRLHVHGLHIDCTRQCHGSHPANGRSSTCSHIWQMHVLSPLDSTSILYRHVVCLRLCCACSFFPFETPDSLHKFASLVKEAGEFGHQPTAVAGNCWQRAHCHWFWGRRWEGLDAMTCICFSFFPRGSPKNLKNRSWVRDYMSMRGTLAVMKHNS